MTKRIVMDVLHLTLSAPAGMDKAAYAPIRRALPSKAFAARLRQQVRSAVAHFPSLRAVRLTISA